MEDTVTSRPLFYSKSTPRYQNGQKINQDNRNCRECGKQGFLSGVVIVKRGYVVTGLCLKCAKRYPDLQDVPSN